MYNVKKFSELIGVSVKTIQRWDRENKLKPISRTPGNHRLYSQEQINQFLGISEHNKITVVYSRVSGQSQKQDLNNQRLALEQFCIAKGIEVSEWISEIGGGLNFKRPKFINLIDRIIKDEIGILVIAHKDRLTRFGFDLLLHLCETHNCKIIILNTESLSPEQEMVEDLMTIIHCFSSRLYGLRNYRKSIQKALQNKDNDKVTQD